MDVSVTHIVCRTPRIIIKFNTILITSKLVWLIHKQKQIRLVVPEAKIPICFIFRLVVDSNWAFSAEIATSHWIQFHRCLAAKFPLKTSKLPIPLSLLLFLLLPLIFFNEN